MKRKIYLIADKHNNALAHELLQGNPYHITDIKHLAMLNSASGATIIVLLDDNPSQYLLKEIRYAINISTNSEKYNLIPIVIGDAEIPACLRNRIYLTLSNTSSEDKNRIRVQINKFLHNNLLNDTSNSYATRKKETSRELVLLTTMATLFTTIISIILLTTQNNMIMSEEFTLILFSILVSATMVLVTATYAISFKQRNRIENENEIKSYSKRLIKAISIDDAPCETDDSTTNNTHQEIDALGRMLINLEDIKEFYTWSQKQAKASFILAIVMCIAGFILIAAAVIISLLFTVSTNVSIITGVGGVTVELVAGTALVVYKNSISQLNHYHQALHEDERFLSSATLIEKFSTDDSRDEMLKEIIRSEIQMNLETIRYSTEDNK